MAEDKEKRNKQVGAMVTIGAHALLLLVFFFLLAWREPDPPHPEIGIEINFGTDDQGTGPIQPDQPANESESTEESAPTEEVPQETQEEVVEEVVEETTESTTEEVVEGAETTQDSPDIVEAGETGTKQEQKETEVEEVPKEKVEETKKKVETKKEEVKKDDAGKGGEGDAKDDKAANHGDDKDAVGDKGKPDGDLDKRALVGQGGGGDGGLSVDFDGWSIDENPKTDDIVNQSGRLVLKVKIDDEGYVKSVSIIERSVSSSVADLIKKRVYACSFSPDASNTLPPPESDGKMTFVFKSK
ncbi:MAG: hypothetical protein AAFX87_30055 [Bacteroidota bacterium]